jgi:hypothetical protein
MATGAWPTGLRSLRPEPARRDEQSGTFHLEIIDVIEGSFLKLAILMRGMKARLGRAMAAWLSRK